MPKTRARRSALLSSMALLLGSTALGSPALAQTGGGSGPPNPGSVQTSPAPAATSTGTTPDTGPATPPVAGPAATPPVPAGAAAGPSATTAATNQAGVVRRIVVQGNERIETGTVLSYLPIQVGDTVDAARLDVAIKALARTDLFADEGINLNFETGELVVRVSENAIINQVIFEGNSAINNDKLRDEVSVHPRSLFTRAKVQQDVLRIVELYRRSGRIGATVTPKIVELPQKRVDLIFEISEGPKTGIERVNFLGNKAFADRALRDVVVTKESRWYRFFSSNDNYDPDRIEYDREQLRKFYGNRGYYDFRVVSSVAELTPNQRSFAVTYTIDEGAKYRFGKVRVQTDLKRLNGDVLRQLLPVRDGQLYQRDKIEQAVDALTFAAGAAGFASVDIHPRETPNRQNHTVDLTFEVKEGPRVYVERIDIVGNTVTVDPVIRREMRIAEGDAFNQVLVDRSKTEIRRLDFFKTVDITREAGSAPDRTVLQVKVQEQPTGSLSLGAGYSSIDQLMLDIGISQTNFRGHGEDVRARASIGYLRQQLDLSFTEPRFLGRDLRAGANVYSYRYDLTQYSGYNSQSTGAGLVFGFPLNVNTYVNTRYQLHADRVVVSAADCAAGTISVVICSQSGSSLTSLVGYTLNLDRRNDAIRPSRGFYAALNQDLAGVGGDVKYLKTTVDGGVYHGFSPNWILSTTGSIGYISPYGGDLVRINDRFFKGGNTFRGFQTAGIGPRDIKYNEALGGKFYAIGTMELSLPNYLPEQYGIRTALFTDIGTLGMLDKGVKTSADIRDDLKLRASAGLSVFWTSPLGPIRLDFSQVLAKAPYDRTEAFRFSTSTQF